MAYQIVDADQLATDLTNIANAIRAKAGTSGKIAFPDEFISAVNGIVIPTFKTTTKSIISSRVDQEVTPGSGYDGLSKVTVSAFRYTRIAKTIGSANTMPYSIPLSEIGFAPRIWAVTMYNKDSSTVGNSTISQNWLIAGICDMQHLETNGSSTSGCLVTTGKKFATFGTGTKGEVNGTNFTFTSNFVYFAKSHIYRFFFWG